MATRTNVVTNYPFTGTDGQPISASDWTQINAINSGNVQYESNHAAGQYSAQPTDQVCCAKWIGSGSFTDDQFASCVLINPENIGDNYREGVMVRATGTTSSNYGGYQGIIIYNGASTFVTYIGRVVNGTVTRVASQNVAWATNDVISIEALAGVISIYRNSETTPVVTYTDGSPLTGGVPGVCCAGGGKYVDDWNAGVLTAEMNVSVAHLD